MPEPYFDEKSAVDLFRAWKTSGDIRQLDELLKLLAPIAQRLIVVRQTYLHTPPDELLNDCLLRLSHRLARCYDPARGRLFSFACRVIETTLIDSVRRKRLTVGRLCSLDDTLLNTISTNGEASSRETIDELHFRIMRIGTVFTCPFERQAQKWLIENLLESNFAFHRHEAADSMTVVFGIDPRRSRHIFDLTVLSVRRALLDERKLLPVSVYGLIGTRQKALVRYRHRLNEEDFSRLCFLMRGLAPSIIETGEYTLHEILYGAPGKEKPLFDRSEDLRSTMSVTASFPFTLEKASSERTLQQSPVMPVLQSPRLSSAPLPSKSPTLCVL